MTRHLPLAAVTIAFLLLGNFASAQRLESVGVLGNSGVEGNDLIRVTPTRQPSGVYVAPDSTVWIDGGDAILHVTFHGRLIEAHPLAPVCEKVNSWSFAALDRTLYFFALTDKVESVQVDNRTFRSHMALIALPLSPGARPRLVRSFPEISDSRGGVLSALPLDGRLLFARNRTDATNEEMTVSSIDPADGEVINVVNPGGRNIAGLALDAERGWLYVGGNWPDARSPEIVAYDLTGKELKRTMALQTPANPTQFRGIVSLAGDAIWEGAWYGHLGRWNLDLDTAPGTIWTWGLEFNYPCQLVAAAPGHSDVLMMSEQDNQSVYFAHWDCSANRFRLAKRIGSLAEAQSLAMSDDGWVTVGTSGRTLWWKWGDDAVDPPRAGNHIAGAVNGYFHRSRMVTLQPGRGNSRPVAVTFEPSPGRRMSQVDYGQFTPFAAPAGLTRTTGDPTAPNDHGWAYATDADSNTVWRTRIEARRGVPIASQWKEMAGDITFTQLGGIASLPGSRLALADGGSVVFARIDGDSLVEERRLNSWGDMPEQKFGSSMRLAANGLNLLASDTTRHRVLWFDADRGTFLAQAGSTDAAGTGANDFDRPTALAVIGTRAVVYDSGNQRIIRLSLVGTRHSVVNGGKMR